MPRIHILALTLACCIAASGQTFEVASIRLSDPTLVVDHADRLPTAN